MDNGGIKLFVSVILGIVIALFVGVGINAFYPEPPFPEQTVTYTTEEPTEAELEESERAFDAYEQLRQQHSGVVGVISLAIAVLLMGGSMFIARRNMVISQGLLVGGMLLICYGALQTISSGNTMVAFISIGVGLAALVFFILKRFKPSGEPHLAS